MMHATIPGAPVGKGRPRLTTRGGFARAYTPKPTLTWEAGAAMVLRSAWGKAPHDGPVRVTVDAVASRPKAMLPREMGGSAPKSRPPPVGRCWRTTKPDVDNVAKATLDALVQAGVIRDDVQVVELVARSLYAALDEGPCVEVTVSEAGTL